MDRRTEPLASLAGLPLREPTPGSWAGIVRENIDLVLVDHAHCEHKAASTALAMIARHAEVPLLIRPLMALAQEEMHHFRQVLDVLDARGVKLARPRADRYVRLLRERCFTAPGGLGALGDQLMVCALVEARSCERFRLLASALERLDSRLAAFYGRLAAAEGRHWELFDDLAGSLFGTERVARRLDRFSEIEAQLVRELPVEPRIH